MKTFEVTVNGQNAGLVTEESILSALCTTMETLCFTYAERVTIVDEEENTQTTFLEVIKECGGSIEYEVDCHDHYPLPYGKSDGYRVKREYGKFHCDSPRQAGVHRTCYRQYQTSAMAKDAMNEYVEVQAFCEIHAAELCKSLGIEYTGQDEIYLD